MHTTTGLQEIIYVSTLAADAPIRVVADIAVKARSNNQQRDITGLRVFDGMHFCQQLEGCAQEVAALMARIRADPRRFRRFSLGYTSVEDIERLERLQQLQGQAAGAAAQVKERITIRLAPDVLAAFRATGRGWQNP